jgi:heme-degrading monooxygenase HmoA
MGVRVVIEYIRYRIPVALHDRFEAAWSTARKVLDEAPQCMAYEVAQGVEDPGNYVVRIEWSSVEDHEQGFRRSAGFGPFFEQVEEMRHYTLTSIVSTR